MNSQFVLFRFSQTGPPGHPNGAVVGALPCESPLCGFESQDTCVCEIHFPLESSLDRMPRPYAPRLRPAPRLNNWAELSKCTTSLYGPVEVGAGMVHLERFCCSTDILSRNQGTDYNLAIGHTFQRQPTCYT